MDQHMAQTVLGSASHKLRQQQSEKIVFDNTLITLVAGSVNFILYSRVGRVFELLAFWRHRSESELLVQQCS